MAESTVALALVAAELGIPLSVDATEVVASIAGAAAATGAGPAALAAGRELAVLLGILATCGEADAATTAAGAAASCGGVLTVLDTATGAASTRSGALTVCGDGTPFAYALPGPAAAGAAVTSRLLGDEAGSAR